MKKKLVLLLMCVIMCCAIVATTLVACNDKDTWTFKVEGVTGYSDAIVDEANKTVSFNVQSSINSFDLNNIKIPATLSYTVKDADKKSVTGNMILLNSGDNTYYMTFKGDVDISGKKYSVDVEWTIKIKRLTSELKITDAEIDTFETTYTVGEAFKGGKIKLTYADKSTVLVDIYLVMVTGFDTAKAGARTITIKYDDYTFERTINVINGELDKFEDVTPTVITKIDDALNTFARLGAIIVLGETDGDRFNEYKNDYLKTLNKNKAEMKSFLESIGVTDANIDNIATITDKIAPIVKKIFTVIDTGENYEQLYTQEFIAEIQVVAKDILGMFSPSQLTLAAEKIANSLIENSLISESEYKEYITPISDAAIAAKVIAQFEMWTDGDYRDFPLDKKDIFAYAANAKNVLNFFANIEPKKVSVIVDTIIKIATMDDMTLDNIKNISTKNLKDTINYIGEIICGIDVNTVDRTSLLSYANDIMAFIGIDETNYNVFNIIVNSCLLDSKGLQIIGEVLMNLTADNVLEIFDIAKVFLAEEPENIEAEYGNIIHYVGRMVTPVIDKHYSSSEYNSFLNNVCEVYTDIMNTTTSSIINKDELKKAVTDAYKLIYNASKKETLTTTEKAGLYNGIMELLDGVNTTYNPLRIENYYRTAVLPANIAEADFYEYLNSKYSLYSGNYGRLPFAKEICSGIDLTKAGSQTMTIKVEKYTTTMKLYFVDDSNKGDFSFELSGVNTNYINIRFALNSNPNDYDAYASGMYLLNRKDKVAYSLTIDYSNAKYIGVDTKSTGHKKAIVESTDWVFGTVYFPIDYVVYDPENLKIENESVVIDNFYLGLSDKLTGKLYLSYDSGYSEYIELPDNIFSHLKKDAIGNYTGTVEYNSKSYRVQYYVRDDVEDYFRKNLYFDYGRNISVGTGENALVFNFRGNDTTLGEINAWLAERNLGSIYVDGFDSSTPGYYYNVLFFKYTNGRLLHLDEIHYKVNFGDERSKI